MFITNVKALTFNVDVTNIEDKGNNGTIGTISNIDIDNKTLDASFQDIGDEVNFDITITNSGNRAGALKSIGITSTNDKIEYTHNLPSEGLAINGNDTNTVTITAKVLEGATNGTSTTQIKITYNYDEGSCPEGEILSEDESMCLCPTGKERSETGTCVEPEKPVECEENEIYNTEKKICEEKVVPVEPDEPTPEPKKEEQKVVPSNPKTLDNIILVTLLFIVSGLGIYAVMYKRLKTNKTKVAAGVATGVVTLSLSFTVLAGVFGLDNLFSAIVNPITKKQELIVTVNETIDIVETWDGNGCSLGTDYDDLIPENIFEGGSGTEQDPYTIKTVDQLQCFMASVNVRGETYEGKYVKQIRNIKLNDHLVENIENNDDYWPNTWTSIGNHYFDYYFAGTYDGDNHVISGMLLNDYSMNQYSPKGFFGYTKNATVENLTLSDVYIKVNSGYNVGGLIGRAEEGLTVKNITTSGKVAINEYGMLALPGNGEANSGGIIGYFYGNGNNKVTIENCENNIGPVSQGIIGGIQDVGASDEPNIVIKNVVNNGEFWGFGGIAGGITNYNYGGGNVLIDGAVNNGSYGGPDTGQELGGVLAGIHAEKVEIKNSGNKGNIVFSEDISASVGGIAESIDTTQLTINNCYNSGNISSGYNDSYATGLTTAEVRNFSDYNRASLIGGILAEVYIDNTIGSAEIKNSFNTGTLSAYGTIGGIVGESLNQDAVIDGNIVIDNCYNEGEIFVGSASAGGIIAVSKGTIKDSHNSGKITFWGTDDRWYWKNAVGGLSGKGYNKSTRPAEADRTGVTIIDSYNEGEILVTAKSPTVSVGGLCAECTSISGSNNSGNITSKYASQYFEGLGIATGTITDSTNTGTITTENLAY
jgi:hypothetical protein